jgi:hypothetical protein
MKHRIIAVALAVFASPVLALEVGPPFEQTQLDRELPNIQFTPVEPYVADSRAPYEQAQMDRALPNLPERSDAVAGPSGPGSARPDARSDLRDYFEKQRQITDGHVQFIAQPQ